MNDFQLLKQTFPISKFDRDCDGYKYIMDMSKTVRLKLGINDNNLQKIIVEGEKYLYRVGKENGEFKTMCISLSNFETIRKNVFEKTDI